MTPAPPIPRTLVLSDLHLGYPGATGRAAPTPARLRPLWQHAEALVINGDAAELQMPHARAEAARQLDALLRLAEQDGVEVTLLSGNHDAMVSDQRFALLAGGAVLVTHGDVLHPAIAPWSPAAPDLEHATSQAVAALETHGEDEAPVAGEDDDLAALAALLSAYQHAGHAGFLGERHGHARSAWATFALQPQRIARVLAYWRSMPDRAAGLLERFAPRCSVIVIGHAHRPGVWRRRGKLVLNTGSFRAPGRPRAVWIEPHDTGARVSMRRVAFDGRHYTFTGPALVEHRLAA